ncbi:glycosyltransferase family 4 protein [Saprospiraceae bacterium]|nr:glycosyltransferase family 4 protein [Saprospiraceae bacterium]
MRIALVANSTWNIYNFRLNVINKLLSEGHEVIVVAPVDEYLEYKEKYPDIQHYGIRSLDRDSTNPLKDLLLVAELTRRYRIVKPDLILHYTNKPNIFGAVAAWRRGVPSIAMVTGLGYPFIRGGWIKKLTSFLYKSTSRFHDKFIFENIADRELFEEKSIIKKDQGVSIKGCGVDVEFYKPRGSRKGDEVVFTFIGRLLYDKGIKEFVEAAKKIKEKNKSIKFWVVGELDPDNPATLEKEQLANWVNNSIIEYHGFQRDVRNIIHDSSCIVLPSYREAIPRTITEGMSMGKPVITTDTAGCREAVDVGVNGYLVKVKNSESLAEGFEKFIKLTEDQRKKMGDKGREKVLSEFDDRKIADAIYGEIEKVLIKRYNKNK